MMPPRDDGKARPKSRSAVGYSDKRLEAWLRARARLMPGLLAQSPPWIRSVFDHTWAPMQALRQQARCLPPMLWPFLLDCAGGFVAITAGESRYAPGPAIIRHQHVCNVAFISAEDLARDNERALHTIGHLIDHHLGCGGDLDAPWLSEGGGLTANWQAAAARVQGLFALGYGVDEVAQANVRDYFAQSMAFYCRERRRLNVTDPQIYKWFRSTLWYEPFWQTTKRREGG